MAPGRVAVTPLLDLREHLAVKRRLCSLSLDTFPYGAHSTAADMLWAGVPHVTLGDAHPLGGATPSRVGASLLRSVGCGALVASSWKDWARLAGRLLASPPLLAAAKARLRRGALRRAGSAFDLARSARALEGAFEALWEARAARAAFAGRLPAGPAGQRTLPHIVMADQPP